MRTARKDACAPVRALPWRSEACTPYLKLRKQNRKRQFRGEYATSIVTAERNHQNLVLRLVLLVDIVGEGLTPREPGGALSHRRTRRIKTPEWQNVQLSEQVRHSPRSQLLLKL